MSWISLFVVISIVLFIFLIILNVGNIQKTNHKIDDLEQLEKKKLEMKELEDHLKKLAEINISYSKELDTFTEFHETVLKKSSDLELQFKTLFNNSPIGICRVSISGKYIYANPALARMLGYFDATELTSLVQNTSEQIFMFPDERKRVIKKLSIKPYEPVLIEHELKKKNGTSIFTRCRYMGVLNEREQLSYMDVIIEDISDLKKKEQELYDQNDMIVELLKEQQEMNDHLDKQVKERTKELEKKRYELEKMNHELLKMKNLFENMYKKAPIGLFRSSISTGKFLSCNDATAHIFDVRNADEFLKIANALDIWGNKKGRDELIEYFRNLLPMTIYNHVDHCQTPISKKERYVSVSEIANFDDDYFEGAFIDVTEEYLAKKKLEEMNKNLENIVNERTHNLIEQYAYTQQLISELEESNNLLKTKTNNLELNQLKLKSIIKTIPDSIIVCKINGKITESYNIPMNLFHGDSIDSILSLFNLDNASYLIKCFEKMIQKHNPEIQSGMIKELYNNQISWFEYNIFKMNSDHVILVFRDITSRIQTKTLLDSILHSIQILLSKRPFECALYESLEWFSKLNNVQRVFVYKNEEGSYISSLLSEYHEEHLFDLNKDQNRQLDYQKMSDDLSIYNQLKQGKCVEFIMKNEDHEKLPIVKRLKLKGVKSILCVPIIFQSDFLGYLGISDYVSDRIWSETEKQTLLTFATNIGLMMEKENF